jgi:hypothetical protein
LVVYCWLVKIPWLLAALRLNMNLSPPVFLTSKVPAIVALLSLLFGFDLSGRPKIKREDGFSNDNFGGVGEREKGSGRFSAATPQRSEGRG